MNFVTLTEKEFQKFADTHPLRTFFQTTYWAEIKKDNGWQSNERWQKNSLCNSTFKQKNKVF